MASIYRPNPLCSSEEKVAIASNCGKVPFKYFSDTCFGVIVSMRGWRLWI